MVSNTLVMTGTIVAFVGLMGYAIYVIFFKKPGGAANSELTNYVQQYMSQGYDANSIKQGLMAQNYSEKDIDAAIAANR